MERLRSLYFFLAIICLVVIDNEVLAAEPVDVVLVLAVDVSRSMSDSELDIQREGYASAIRHPDVIAAIKQGAYGRIAVTMFEWAADFHKSDVFGWTLIENNDDAEALAQIILETPAIGRNRTSISGAIRRGIELIETSPYQGFRKVIDISGDGPNNQGEVVLAARNAALAKKIAINGLPLMTYGDPGFGLYMEDLDIYYRDCVTGGPGSFIVPVNSWDQFPEAVRRKLVQEIGILDQNPPPVVKAQAGGKTTDCEIGEKIWLQRQWMFDGN